MVARSHNKSNDVTSMGLGHENLTIVIQYKQDTRYITKYKISYH